jgi:hypothetical protein
MNIPPPGMEMGRLAKKWVERKMDEQQVLPLYALPLILHMDRILEPLQIDLEMGILLKKR